MRQQVIPSRANTDTVGSRFSFVFITDPLSELAPAHDTTVALMEAAQALGHRVLVTTIAELGVTAGRATAQTRDVTLQPAVLIDGKWIVGTNWFVATESEQIFLDTAAAIFMRTDPPVNADYLRATYILDLVDPARTLMLNSPSGLRDANEKLFALRFPQLGPPTLISADQTEIIDAVQSWGRAVLKPTDGMAGRGSCCSVLATPICTRSSIPLPSVEPHTSLSSNTSPRSRLGTDASSFSVEPSRCCPAHRRGRRIPLQHGSGRERGNRHSHRERSQDLQNPRSGARQTRAPFCRNRHHRR